VGVCHAQTTRRDARMSASGPTKPCPRCNTPLPAGVAFCGTCGWQFSAPSSAGQNAPLPGTGYTFPPTEPGPMGSWTQNWPDTLPPGQTGFAPQGQAGFSPPARPEFAPPGPAAFAPQGQAGFAPQGQPNYVAPGGVGAPPPAKRSKTTLIVIIAILAVLLVGSGTAGAIIFSHKSSSNSASTPTTNPAGPGFDRHGLPQNVPLPNEISFQTRHNSSALGATVDTWYWTVASPDDPATAQQFYQNNLPNNGWNHITKIPGTNFLGACQGNQVLLVDASKKLPGGGKNGSTLNAPSGGSALGIGLTSDQTLVRTLCQSLPLP